MQQVLNGYRNLQNVFVGKAERLGLKAFTVGTRPLLSIYLVLWMLCGVVVPDVCVWARTTRVN